MTDKKNQEPAATDTKDRKSSNKKLWKKPKLNKLNTEHTSGTTPVRPGDAGNLRS